jgi:hypothetical protein
LFGKPLPRDEFAAFIERNDNRTAPALRGKAQRNAP